MPDARAILQGVLAQHQDADKWVGKPFEHIKRLSNSKVGDVGQDFVEALCREVGLDCEFPLNRKGTRARQNPWDIKVEGVDFELKTATEDVSGSFQFNHIRYHRPYDAVLCVGISPDNIYMNTWSKAEIVTGKAGNLVSMESGANASYKLTKRPDALHSIDEFEAAILNLLEREGLRGGSNHATP
jgi:hypothetical protein